MLTWWMKLGENLPPGHDSLLFSISGMGSCICPVAQTRLDILRPLFTQAITVVFWLQRYATIEQLFSQPFGGKPKKLPFWKFDHVLLSNDQKHVDIRPDMTSHPHCTWGGHKSLPIYSTVDRSKGIERHRGTDGTCCHLYPRSKKPLPTHPSTHPPTHPPTQVYIKPILQGMSGKIWSCRDISIGV